DFRGELAATVQRAGWCDRDRAPLDLVSNFEERLRRFLQSRSRGLPARDFLEVNPGLLRMKTLCDAVMCHHSRVL
ncbi:MAG: hypothetical protein VX035_05250, partial [Planctomycetota bacterium]|nr:hypothetical protein [Planctomycetota bacterium]